MVEHGLALKDPPLAMALLQDVFVVARPANNRSSGLLHVSRGPFRAFLFRLRINTEEIFVVRGSGRTVEVDVAGPAVKSNGAIPTTASQASVVVTVPVEVIVSIAVETDVTVEVTVVVVVVVVVGGTTAVWTLLMSA